MKKQFLLLFSIVLLAVCGTNLQAQSKGKIAWLGNNLKADSLYFDVLKKGGYEVVDKTATKGDLTAVQIADLNTYDLVILSRSLNSADYNYPTKYDAIQVPFLCMANMAARNTRLRMFAAPNVDDATTVQDVMAAMDVKHPIFHNIALSGTRTLDIATPGIIIKPLLKQKSAGNGKLIGVTAKDSLVLVAEWAAKQPYYAGSIDTLHGKRMVYFNTQGSNLTVAPYTSNLSANGNHLLLNIAEYMITGAVAEPKKVSFITENPKSDSLYVDLLTKNGYSVNVISNLMNKTPSDSALAVLEKSAVILFSRNTTSGGYQALTQYNKLATPILLMSAYLARSSRWQILDTGTAVDNDALSAKVLDSTHPIFKGITLDASNVLGINTTAKIGTCAISTAPNANVIATSATSGNILIAEWKKNTKFYDKSSYSAVGHRMVFFLSGGFDLTADAKSVFLNSVKYLSGFDFDTVFVPHAPTDLMLSKTTMDEKLPIGSLVGTLSATDLDAGTVLSYSLVAGNGTNDADNSLFVLDGASLKTKSLLDYATKTSYSVNLQVSDGALTLTKSFTILLNKVNQAPTDLMLSNTAMDEELPIGSLVGMISALDPDAGTAFTYSLVAGNGKNDADNSLFVLDGANLKTKAILDYETKTTYAVNIQVSDGTLTLAKSFTIQLNNVIETGIADLQNNVVRIFPNPFTDVVYLQSKEAGQATISVYDVNGQVVYQKLHRLSTELALKLNIPAGIYILNIQGKNSQYNYRLVRK